MDSSTKDLPTSLPFAAMRVLAIPPKIILSMDLERESIRLSLVDTFAPPRIATEFFEFSFTDKAFSSHLTINLHMHH